MKKNVVNILPEDRIYTIAAQIVKLQEDIQTKQKELEALKTEGAEILSANGWSHAKCADFTVYLMDHYAGIDWNKLKKLYPDFSKKCFSKKLPMAKPKITVTKKKK